MPPRPAPPIPATSAGKTNVFLVDGYALIYRAFFAMIARPLTTKRGENTSAVWGITNFLLRLYENYHPEYIGWVHDRGVSFRSAEYPEYKATREKLSDELQQDFDRSLERVCQILDAFHIPVIAINGYEADDVVATLAARAATNGLQAVIVSGDKDFYQLIGPGIALLNPGRGGQAAVEEQWVDQSNASERLGVPPAQVVDFLALVGDNSDNIPGVKGVGDKTALQLLETYGDLDTILAKAAEIPGKRPREALLANAGNARLSRQLVTLKRDVPVELDLEQLRVRTPDTESLAALFTELEFRTLIPKLSDLDAVGTAPPGDTGAAAPGGGGGGGGAPRRRARLSSPIPRSSTTRRSWRRCWTSCDVPASWRFEPSPDSRDSRSRPRRGVRGTCRSGTGRRKGSSTALHRATSPRSRAMRSRACAHCSPTPPCVRRATTSRVSGSRWRAPV